jgi:hypothetical protein
MGEAEAPGFISGVSFVFSKPKNMSILLTLETKCASLWHSFE